MSRKGKEYACRKNTVPGILQKRKDLGQYKLIKPRGGVPAQVGTGVSASDGKIAQFLVDLIGNK